MVVPRLRLVHRAAACSLGLEPKGGWDTLCGTGGVAGQEGSGSLEIST